GAALLFTWAFRALPREGWQVMAAIPRGRDSSGDWQATNFTYYGVFQASACVLAVALMLLLMGILGVPQAATLGLAAATFAICLPATGLIARWVEKQPNTLTVGGASFVGFLLLPWTIWGVNATWGRAAGFAIPLTAAMAATSTCYALGEGVGRL